MVTRLLSAGRMPVSRINRRTLFRGAGAAGIAVVGSMLADIPVSLAAMPASSARDPDPAPTHADIPYVENGGARQTLDIYLPASAAGIGTPEAGTDGGKLTPVLVWIHGGGWVGGEKHVGLPYLLDDGYAIVSINYRLLQDAMFPAQIVDANAAVAWVWHHADAYRFDREQLVVAGSSAGGRSASLVATSANDRVDAFAADPEVRIAALVDFFGGTESDYELARNPGRTALIEGALTADQVEEMKRQIDVRTFVDAGDPPTLIVHGEQDRTVPIAESEELVATMQAAGVPVTFVPMAGRGHGLKHYQDDTVKEIVRTFLQTTLGRG